MPYESISQTAADLVSAVSTLNVNEADDNAWLQSYDSSDIETATAGAAGLGSLDDLASALSAAGVSAGQQSALYMRAGFVTPPWVQAPDSFISFAPLLAINTPAVGSGDQMVLTLVVPPGYDGILRRLNHNYNGPGFQEGSGGIVWRLIIDGQAVRNFDNMICSFGSPQTPRELDGGIRIFSGQTISYVVNVAGGGGFVPSGGTQIICGLSGWFYPRQVA